MKVLVISTAVKSTPPVAYGGIERVVSILVEALIGRGHDVTLVATPGSHCSGRTVVVSDYDPARSGSTVSGRGWVDEEPLYRVASGLLDAEDFDLVHDWSFQNHLPLRQDVPAVISTCIPPPPDYARPNLVACSKAHAELCGPGTRYVHYGLPLDEWPFVPEKQDHFVHVAKIAPYKGQHLALRAARKAGVGLWLGGNVEKPSYYWTRVKPLILADHRARYLGELSGTRETLGPARALVQTPLWFDAFPVVVLESLACGTPVISLSTGGTPEQIDHGRTGFLCRDQAELTSAMRSIGDIDPVHCREEAEARFSADRMAADYEALYRRVLQGERW